MKYLFALALAVYAAPGYAQSDELVTEIEKAVVLNIQEPPEVLQDSCYYTSALVKLEIGRHYEIRSITFSDAAPAWLKAEQAKLMSRLRAPMQEKISALTRKEHIRKAVIILPLTIYSIRFPCDKVMPGALLPSKDYFLFEGQPLRGKLFFGRAIGEAFHPPVR